MCSLIEVDKLRKDYEKAMNGYMAAFSKKQGLEFDHWVGDIVGDIAVFGDFFFNPADIIWDINSNQPKRLIIQWYDEFLEDAVNCPNYYSYTKGLRAKDVKNRKEI